MEISSTRLIALNVSFNFIPIGVHEVLLVNRVGSSYRLQHPSIELTSLAEDILRGSTITNLINRFGNGDAKQIASLKEFLENLDRLGALRSDLDLQSVSAEEQERFKANLSFFRSFEKEEETAVTFHKRLRNAHFLLIGLGGLGGPLLDFFARAGVGSITGIDMDVVEPSNLPRNLLYREDDIGKKKVAAAAENVSRISKFTRFRGIDSRIGSAAELIRIVEESGNVDLILLTADRPIWSIIRWCAEAAMQTGVPLLRNHALGVGPFMIPGKTACPFCEWNRLKANFPNIEEIMDFYRRSPDARATSNIGTIGTKIAIPAALMAQEAISFVTKTEKVQTFNAVVRVSFFNGLHIDRMELPRDPLCDVCGTEKRDVPSA